MNFLTVDYKEFEKNSYKSIDLTISHIESKFVTNDSINVKSISQTVKFDTGNPIVDYYEYVKYRYEYIKNEIVAYSSTVDHFTSDCNYIWRYIDSVTGKFFSDDEINLWIFNREWDKFDKHLSVICSNRIKTRKGYNKHIKNWYKLHPKTEPTIVTK